MPKINSNSNCLTLNHCKAAQTQLLLTWVLEVLGGRFDNEGRLEGGGHWVSFDDFRDHTTYEWVKANRDAASRTGLINIHGNEPDESEIGLLIKRSGLPIESKRGGNTDQPEISDQGVDVSPKSVQGSPSFSYKKDNLKATPAQKNGTRQKRDRSRVLTIDPSTVLTPPKPTDSVARRVFDGILTTLAMLIGAKLLDDGRLEVNKDAGFRLDDLRQGDWYEWVLANKTLINKAKLGSQIKGDAPTNKALSLWLRQFGFKWVSTRVDKGATAKSKAEKSDRTQARFYRLVPSQEPEFIRDNLARRADDLYYKKAAQDWLDQKAAETAEYGTPLTPAFPATPVAARLTVRYGILDSLHIRSDGRGGLTCKPDFAFTFKGLMDEPWYKWACEQLDAINNAGLGAKVNGDAPSVQVLTAWVKAMGIELSSKKIDARKLLSYKRVENKTSSNTGGDPVGMDTIEALDHLNKTVGVENNSIKNRELKAHERRMVNAYFINQRCLNKVRETMDNDVHEREDELITQIVNAPETIQNKPVKSVALNTTHTPKQPDQQALETNATQSSDDEFIDDDFINSLDEGEDFSYMNDEFYQIFRWT